MIHSLSRLSQLDLCHVWVDHLGKRGNHLHVLHHQSLLKRTSKDRSDIKNYHVIEFISLLMYLFMVYLMILSAAETMWHWMVCWLGNDKYWAGRKVNICTMTILAWKDWGKPWKTVIRIAILCAEMWTYDPSIWSRSVRFKISICSFI